MKFEIASNVTKHYVIMIDVISVTVTVTNHVT